MVKKIQTFISTCTACMAHNPVLKPTRAPLQPLPCGSCPFETMNADFAGPLTLCSCGEGHRHILGLTCSLTRFTVCYPVKDQSAETWTNCIANFVLTYSCPQQIRLDQGAGFISTVSESLSNKFGIVLSFSPSHSPKSNSLAETIWRITIRKMAPYINTKNHSDWCQILPSVISCLNSTPREILGGEDPYFLVYGTQKRFSYQGIETPVRWETLDICDFALQVQYRLLSAWSVVKSIVEWQRKKHQDYYNRKSRLPVVFSIGDKVWCCNYPSLKKGGQKSLCQKFLPKYLPFRVREVKGSMILLSDLNDPGKIRMCHVDQLRPIIEPEAPCLLPYPDSQVAPLQSGKGSKWRGKPEPLGPKWRTQVYRREEEEKAAAPLPPPHAPPSQPQRGTPPLLPDTVAPSSMPTPRYSLRPRKQSIFE